MVMPDWNWQRRAACRGKDLRLFFTSRAESPAVRDALDKEAKAICAGCPVRRQCLDHALYSPERYGTWGGLDEDERASFRRRRQRAGLLATS